ncbi:MAG: solute carrier family 23 protein, partial [Oscillospiraceae bacterium]
SFAYIGAIQLIMEMHTDEAGGSVFNTARIPYVQGAVIIAGLIYVAISVVIYFIGVERIRKIFPPVVIGPVIVVIGLTLSPTAINMASGNWAIAVITLGIVILLSIFAKGFFKLVPVLIGIFGGYLASLPMIFCSRQPKAHQF